MSVASASRRVTSDSAPINRSDISMLCIRSFTFAPRTYDLEQRVRYERVYNVSLRTG
jgi:hypothetical protein